MTDKYRLGEQGELKKKIPYSLDKRDDTKIATMNDDDSTTYRTLRGFIEGDESNEETYFYHKATLRIFGENLDFSDISSNLNLTPTNTHQRGDKKGPNSPGFKEDMWSFTPTTLKSEPLEHHIDALWMHLRSNKEYLLELKKSTHISVFLGYRSNCDHAGIDIPYTSLEMFIELQIPFGVSIIVG